MWQRIIGSIVGPLLGVIDKSIKDKDLAVRIKNDLNMALLSMDSKVIDAAMKVIVAEAGGESWMQRNWRPLTMLTFVAIIANNYIIVPYANAFGLIVPMLEIPPGMWGLLTVGIGGYVGGRSWEKIEKIKAEKKNAG